MVVFITLSGILKVGYGIRFFGHFCKITWNPYHNPLTATESEVLTWKLNLSIICGTGRARKIPANHFHCHELHWTVSTSIKWSYCTPTPPRPARDPFVHVLKPRDPEQASVRCYPTIATGARAWLRVHVLGMGGVRVSVEGEGGRTIWVAYFHLAYRKSHIQPLI